MSSALDTIVVTATTVVGAAANLLLTNAAAADDQLAELKLLLLPLLGAVIVSGGMIMLNPSPETRRIVIGRGIFSLFFGALGPSLIGMIHPSLAEISLKPAVLLAIGGVLAGLTYVLSKPFTRELYERAARVASAEADRLEKRYVTDRTEPPQGG